jgi:streptogramin lyase
LVHQQCGQLHRKNHGSREDLELHWSGIDSPWNITEGPDGALWFTNTNNNSIGPITTTGAVSNYTRASVQDPTAITEGPGGALWFTNNGGNGSPGSIGRISTSGVISNYTSSNIEEPTGIALGSEGALWFTNRAANTIGRITTAGQITDFTGTGIDQPFGIASGPDGALWFTNNGNNSIGRITTSGSVTNFTGSIVHPEAITSGSDGALWFTSNPGTSIGRITIGGIISSYTGAGVHDEWGIAAGPDGALWFTNQNADARAYSIGRITTVPVLTVSPGSGVPGMAVTVNGGGYQQGEQVNVTYKTGLSSPSSASICSTTASFERHLQLCRRHPPTFAGANGAHRITASGMTSRATAKTIFTLTLLRRAHPMMGLVLGVSKVEGSASQ